MLSDTERNQFQKHLSTWVDFSSSRTEEHIDLVKESIVALYAELDLKEPQIVPCFGPLQQAIFPTLIGLMLRHGKEKSSEAQFQKIIPESPIVSAEWTRLWQEALSVIDWERATLDLQTNTGASLNLSIERLINKSVRMNLIAYLDQELGMEEHQELEELCKHTLQIPFQRLRDALIFDGDERQNIWKSFTSRLPESFQQALRCNKRQPLASPLVPNDRGARARAWMGGWDWYWFATADSTRNMVSLPMAPQLASQLEFWTNLSHDATSYLFCEHCCFIYFRPREVCFDQTWRLHHEQKAAVDFVDGTQFFCWHGVEVEDYIITQPDKINVKLIEAEHNAEVRRVMIERYGIDNFIRDSATRKVQEDACGILYVKELPFDEPLAVVKVLNSTQEPDGSYKTYFLRVPPETRTAREGIAWTFGLEEDEYLPVEET